MYLQLLVQDLLNPFEAAWQFKPPTTMISFVFMSKCPLLKINLHLKHQFVD